MITWIAAAVAVIVCALWYWIAPSSFPYMGAKDASGSYVLFLSETITDAQGFPYLGAVLYDVASASYSYIATNDEGLITPVGPSAFSADTQYLAIRHGEESNDLVVYDRATLSLVAVVESLAIGETVSATVWAPDGSTFAYAVVGGESPALMTADTEEVSPTQSAWFGTPIGFSPDSSKLLIHATPAPIMVNLADDTGMQTSGIEVNDETELVLSPSGEYLVAISNGTAEWFAVDWNASAVSSLEKVALKADPTDVLFTSDDTLAVRSEGSDALRTYTYAPETGVESTSVKLLLPEGSRILRVISW